MHPTAARTRTSNGDRTSSPIDHPTTRAGLAAAWAAFSLMYIYVDLLSFYKPDVIDEIRSGVVFEFAITQAFLVAGFTLVAIPFFMVMLSTILPARAARMTNIIVAAVYIPVSVFNVVGETWYGYYALTIGLEVAILIWIIRHARGWPKQV